MTKQSTDKKDAKIIAGVVRVTDLIKLLRKHRDIFGCAEAMLNILTEIRETLESDEVQAQQLGNHTSALISAMNLMTKKCPIFKKEYVEMMEIINDKSTH